MFGTAGAQLCPMPDDPSEPGASHETAITIEDFDAVRAASIEAGTNLDASQPYQCKYIRLTGHYRVGSMTLHSDGLFRDLNTRYGKGGSVYPVLSHAEPLEEPYALQSRDVTITGRFEDRCLRFQRQLTADPTKPTTLRKYEGFCHKDRRRGTELVDVRFEAIGDKPRYRLLPYLQRNVADDWYRGMTLTPYFGPSATPVERAMREWASSLQQGLWAEAEYTVPKQQAMRRRSLAPRDIRYEKTKRIEHYHYHRFLRAMPAFQELEPQTAPVYLFGYPPVPVDQNKNYLFACMCLEPECSDALPRIEPDIYELVSGNAFCTRLDHNEKTGTWVPR